MRTLISNWRGMLGIIPVLLLLGWWQYYPFGLVDDAFIPMVYANNIAQAEGIVFHPGGERVEGFSSPLWVLFLTLGAFLKVQLPAMALLGSQVMGLLCVFLTFCIYRTLFFDSENPQTFHAWFWPLAAGLALTGDVSFVAWSASGMETAAYTFLLLLLAFAVCTNMSWRFISLNLLSLALMRPEGMAYLLPVIAYGLLSRHSIQSMLKPLLLFFLIPFTLFILARYFYFGFPFPNTFYAKHNFGGIELLNRGFEYVFYFFRPRPLFLLAFLGLLLDLSKKNFRSLFIFSLAALQILMVIYEGGDHFTLHRFLVPVIPFLSILAIRGLCLVCQQMIFDKISHSATISRGAVQTVLALFVFILIPAHGVQLFEYSQDTRCNFSQGAQYHISVTRWTESWKNVGIWLQEKYPPGTDIAVINAGAIPFYCQLNCIDMLGLNDVTIAHTPLLSYDICLPGHDKSNADYVLSRKPTLIQLFPLLFFTSKPYPEEDLIDMVYYPSQKEMWNHPQFRRDYLYKTENTRFGYISYFERVHENNNENNDENDKKTLFPF